MNRSQLKEQILNVVTKEVTQLGSNSDRLYKKFMAQRDSLKKEKAEARKEQKRVTAAQKVFDKLSPEVRKLYKEVSDLKKSLSSKKIKISSLAGYLKDIDKYNKKFKQLVEKIKKSPLTKLNLGLDSVTPYSKDTDVDIDLALDDVKEVSPLTGFLKDLSAPKKPSRKSAAAAKDADDDLFGFGFGDDDEETFDFPSLGPGGDDDDLDLLGFGSGSGVTEDPFAVDFAPGVGYSGGGFQSFTPSPSRYTSDYTPISRYTPPTSRYTSAYTPASRYAPSTSRYTPVSTTPSTFSINRPYLSANVVTPGGNLLSSQRRALNETLTDTRVIDPITGRPRSERLQAALGVESAANAASRVMTSGKGKPQNLMTALAGGGRRPRFL